MLSEEEICLAVCCYSVLTGGSICASFLFTGKSYSLKFFISGLSKQIKFRLYEWIMIWKEMRLELCKNGGSLTSGCKLVTLKSMIA